jgi:SpoVK/Ycf46/Vps4 family AAA+-type ATPase
MDSKCTVIFFDEIDALGQSRGGGRNRTSSTSSTGGNQSPMGSFGSDKSGGGTMGGGMDTCSRRVLAELLIQLTRVNDLNGNLPIDEDDNTGFCDLYSNGECDQNDHNIIHQGKIPFDVTSDDDDATPFDGLENTEEVDENSGRDKKEARIIVVAATNRPEDCDPALLRRFSVRAFVGLPQKRDRVQMLKRFLGGIEHSMSDQDLIRLANATDEWSGSDLESLTRDAVMAPIRQCIRRAVQMKRRLPAFLLQTETPRDQHQPVEVSPMCDRNGKERHDSDIDISYQESRRRLIQEFQRVRPVAIEDFMEALQVWAGHNNAWPSSYDWKLSPEQSKNHNTTIHYDSSSDDDDES